MKELLINTINRIENPAIQLYLDRMIGASNRPSFTLNKSDVVTKLSRLAADLKACNDKFELNNLITKITNL